MRYARLVITDGRAEYLDRMLTSYDTHVSGEHELTVVVDDSGDLAYKEWFVARSVSGPVHYVHHEIRRGLAAAIRTGWAMLTIVAPDITHVVHLEDDIEFTGLISLDDWVVPLLHEPSLAQVCLQRAAQSPDELAAGGILPMYAARHGITRHQTGPTVWHEQTHLFSLQPNIYPRWLCDTGWPEHGGEREFTDRLIAARPKTRFAYLGDLHTPPVYEHAGFGVRMAGWRV